MSSTADDISDVLEIPELPPFRTGVTVLGGTAIYDVEQPEPDPERYIRGPHHCGVRTYLVAVLEVEIRDVTSDTAWIGLYATACGAHSIRVLGDPEATIDGELAHSMVEEVDRLRTGPDELRSHYASIVRQTHLPWRSDR